MKRIIFIVLAVFTILSCTVLAADTNSDSSARTTPADWAKEDVEKALELGILDPDKTYYYGSFITREEFCELICNFIDTESKVLQTTIKHAESPFTDTENYDVIYLHHYGIINGKGETTFAPNDILTREEAATILSRLLIFHPSLNTESSKNFVLNNYEDCSEISSWAENGVNKMTNLGVMEGYSQNVFGPKGIYSIEEAVVTLMRLHNCIEESHSQFSIVSFADALNMQMPEDENYMFSPLSIKMALALSANGANGETKSEILDCMLVKDIDKYNEYSKELISKYSQSDKLTLNISNSVWVNTDNCPHDFKDEYKNIVSEYYNAEANQVNKGEAVQKINTWVNDKTNGRIPTIIDDSDFWSALVNAIYFKGAWENEFRKSATKKDTFHNADGTTSSIDFMNQTGNFSYSNKDGREIVKMPYQNIYFEENGEGEFDVEHISDVNISMYLIKSDTYNFVEELLNNAEFSYPRIKLSVPKFEVEYSQEITDMLYLDIATNQKQADFSGMMNLSPDEDLWIDKILHKTYISVDEEGTEAAAVTAVMMEGATSARPEEPIEVKFDKPFYFVIRDETNGEILFIGRYAYAE